ncbi:unnamed protein product [marine sediment metagenome]|uniref:Polymerase nucleotidyl transferase domain-containing protein n=1 Tax=marine sediment metagenome TaxID=412755 RepID=X1TDJ5_9ZZZZ
MELERAQKIAAEVVKQLTPYCQKIEVAGSVRRRKPLVHDIDFVLIPSDLWELHNAVLRLGPVRMSGSKLMRVMFNGTQVDIYVASPEIWATLLLIRTSPPYKVSGKTVTEALGKLTREQAVDFTNQINSRLEKQASLL